MTPTVQAESERTVQTIPPCNADISIASETGNNESDEDGNKSSKTAESVRTARPNELANTAGGEKSETVSCEDLPVTEIIEAEDKAVLRKLDRVILPLTMIAYTLQYIDRSAMSYAAVFTFRKDLNLIPGQYGWLGSLFFFGYLFFEFPGTYILHRLPLSTVMGTSILVWGSLLMCMAASRQFASAATIRFLLGCAEALVTPGFVLLVSRFYKREEQPLRVGLWYCCNGAGSFLGALVSYGMGHVSVGGMPEWSWIFIFNGGVTVLFAIVFLVLCPENPHTCRFLSPHERLIALERVRGNKSSLGNKKIKWYQVKEAMCPWLDPQGWAYVCIVFSLSLPNGGLGNFLHLILQSYGYTAFQTILIGLPQAVMTIIFPLSGAYLARKIPAARLYVLMAYMIPCLSGVIIQYKTRNTGALLFGYYILGSFVAAFGICFAAPGANVVGSTKRVVVGGMIFVSYAVGNIVGPRFFIAAENPPFRSGMFASMVSFSLTVPMGAALRLYYVRENSRRDRLAEENKSRDGLAEEYDPNRQGDFSDLTDCENLTFRYAL